jgi:hypothetical protein
MAREHYFEKIGTFFLLFSNPNVAKSGITEHISAPFQKSSDECEMFPQNTQKKKKAFDWFVAK